MIGKRVFNDVKPHLFQKGEYGIYEGVWYAQATPDLCANLGNHTVIEYEDGTITVSPSILVSDGDGGHSWHGFLEKGIWREV